MASKMVILALITAVAAGIAPTNCDAGASSDDDSCLLQSAPQQKNNAEVQAHQQAQRCTHLDASIAKQAAKKKVDCASGRQNGEAYCQPFDEVTCPGSDTKCNGNTDNHCCPNPCPGVPPYGEAANFPCPSSPNDPGSNATACASNVKVEDCLDPCATPAPTPAPTEPPTHFTCTKEDLVLPRSKGMQCSTGATCHSDKIGNCTTRSTCYASNKINTCSTKANCCAGKMIETCSKGATCIAGMIKSCESGATCIKKDFHLDDDSD